VPWLQALAVLAIGLILYLLSGLFPGVLATIAFVVGIVLMVVGIIGLIVGLIRGGPTMRV
jgi:hypothetical protein